jgi:hypothetical protein
MEELSANWKEIPPQFQDRMVAIQKAELKGKGQTTGVIGGHDMV